MSNITVTAIVDGLIGRVEREPAAFPAQVVDGFASRLRDAVAHGGQALVSYLDANVPELDREDGAVTSAEEARDLASTDHAALASHRMACGLLLAYACGGEAAFADRLASRNPRSIREMCRQLRIG